MDLGRLLWVSLGGAVGSGARYALATWMQSRLGSALPYGTLAVNVIGCFLLGALMQASLSSAQISPTVRIALAAGVLGGFTTYSAFNHETLAFFERGDALRGVLYVVLTLACCVAAGLTGQWLARFVAG